MYFVKRTECKDKQAKLVMTSRVTVQSEVQDLNCFGERIVAKRIIYIVSSDILQALCFAVAV